MADVKKSILLGLKHEGGLSDHPNDRGGITKYGISLNTFLKKAGIDHNDLDNDGRRKELVGDLDNDGDVDRDDIKLITLDYAIALYREFFAKPLKIRDFEEQMIADQVFDIGINCGVSIGAMILQLGLSNFKEVRVDKIIGNKTLAAANSLSEFETLQLNNYMVDYRIAYYQDLVRRNSKNNDFKTGWINRALSFKVKL